jgi:glycosyltransferase involved in cell wall biosynthesis
VKIWFDHQVFVTQRYGGVSRYFVELARSLNGLNNTEATIFAPYHINGYLNNCQYVHPLSFQFDFPSRGQRFRPGLIAPLFSLFSRIGKPSIVHKTYYGANSAPRNTRPPAIVTTVHDMIYEKFPAKFEQGREVIRHKLRAMQEADRIICVSQNTRRDLIEHYPFLEQKIDVVYHGVSSVVAEPSGSQAFPEPYLLFVGVRAGYKNFGNLLRALGTSPFLKSTFSLVCFGGGAFTDDELALCEKVGFPADHLYQISGSDELLARAYHQATALVFPSSYEGFGMPLTEAMIQSCPILCSSASCFPEICMDAAAYFDPEDVDSIRICLEKTLGDSDELQRLALAARVRSEVFSWDKCAQQTAKVYEALL